METIEERKPSCWRRILGPQDVLRLDLGPLALEIRVLSVDISPLKHKSVDLHVSLIEAQINRQHCDLHSE